MNRSFLIINPFGIGDVLFSSPLVRCLREEFPGARIVYFCNRKTEPVARRIPGVSATIVYEWAEFEEARKRSGVAWLWKFYRLIRQIAAQRVDCAIDLSLNTQYGFLAWAAGIRRRVGIDFKGRAVFLNKKIPIEGYRDKHVASYYLDLKGLLGLTGRPYPMEVTTDAVSREWARTYLTSGRDVVLSMGGGSSWGKDAHLKHWPVERYGELAARLVNELRCRVLLVGDAVDAVGAPLPPGLANDRRVIDLRGKTSLAQMLAVLEGAALVITNDGGPLHMAQALHRKTIGIFGPVDDKVYGAYPADSPDCVIIKKDLPCRPCYNRFRLAACGTEGACLKGISVQEVFMAAEGLLA